MTLVEECGFCGHRDNLSLAQMKLLLADAMTALSAIVTELENYVRPGT